MAPPFWTDASNKTRACVGSKVMHLSQCLKVGGRSCKTTDASASIRFLCPKKGGWATGSSRWCLETPSLPQMSLNANVSASVFPTDDKHVSAAQRSKTRTTIGWTGQMISLVGNRKGAVPSEAPAMPHHLAGDLPRRLQADRRGLAETCPGSCCFFSLDAPG